MAFGMVFQIGLLILYAFSLNKSPQINISNRSLSLLTLYLGGITSFWWYQGLIYTKQYNFVTFMPFFNFLCFVIFYTIIVGYLRQKDIEKIFKYLGISIGLVAMYAFLQRFNFDQFYRSINSDIKIKDVVGTIGNPSQLAGFLGITLPLFYYKYSKFSIICVYLIWVILGLTNSFAGILSAISGTIFFHCFKKFYKKWDYAILGTGTILGLIYIISKGDFFNWHGRLEYWKYLFPILQKQAIIGGGLGQLGVIWTTILKTTPFEGWRHAHFELYQLAIEAGVIAVGLVAYGLYEYFRKIFWGLRENLLTVISASIFVGFIANSMLNWSAHHWPLAIMGMLGYSIPYAIKNEEMINGDRNISRDTNTYC
jgi:hypothetical protein